MDRGLVLRGENFGRAIVPPLLTLILSIMALTRIAHAPDRLRGRGLAVSGALLSLLGLVMVVFVNIIESLAQ
jgi:hypothetical protein